MTSPSERRKVILALLWKEWREILLIVPVGLLWAVAASLSARHLEVGALPSVSAASNRTVPFIHGTPQPSAEDLKEFRFKWSCVRWMVGVSTAMLLGATALIGASAFAQEREERTEGFLDGLAVGRGRLWAGKLLARALAVAFIYVCAAVPEFLYGLERIVNWELYRDPALLVLVFSAFSLVTLGSSLLAKSLDAVAAGVVFWLSPFFVVPLLFPHEPWENLLRWKSTLLAHGTLGLWALGMSFLVFVHRPFQARGGARVLAWAGGLIPAVALAIVLILSVVRNRVLRVEPPPSRTDAFLSVSANGEGVLVTSLDQGKQLLDANLQSWPVPRQIAALSRESGRAWARRSTIISHPVWSPNGRYVAWIANGRGYGDPALDLTVLDVRDGKLWKFGLPDAELTLDSLASGSFPLAEAQIIWRGDSRRLFVTHLGGQRDALGRTTCLTTTYWADLTDKPRLRTLDPKRPRSFVGRRGFGSIAPSERESEFYVFHYFEAEPTDARAGQHDEFLFRVDIESGDMEIDRDFEAVKQSVAQRAGVADVRFGWTNDVRALKPCGHEADSRGIVHVSYEQGDGAVREVWRLAVKGPPERVISFKTKMLQPAWSPTDVEFLDRDTCLLARSVTTWGTEVPGADYEIVTRRLSDGEDTVLGRLPRGSNLDFCPSPSGKWIVIFSYCYEDQHRSEWRNWLTDSDGRFFRETTRELLPEMGTFTWESDNRLRCGPGDAVIDLEISVEGGKPVLRTRSLIDRAMFPEVPQDHRLIVQASGDTAYVLFSRPMYNRGFEDHRLYRADLKTGKKELLLTLSGPGSSWAGSDSFTVEMVK